MVLRFALRFGSVPAQLSQDESALRAMGASWRLHSDAELEHSRIDILAIFNVDLRDILGIRSDRLCGPNSTLGFERGRRR
jgi:hypothetical protein